MQIHRVVDKELTYAHMAEDTEALICQLWYPVKS